jgi:hypothetical protein
MRAKAIQSRETGSHIDDEESKLPSRNDPVSDFGVGLATQISKVRLETRARRARDLFCERKICEIGVWAPVKFRFFSASPP